MAAADFLVLLSMTRAHCADRHHRPPVVSPRDGPSVACLFTTFCCTIYRDLVHTNIYPRSSQM